MNKVVIALLTVALLVIGGSFLFSQPEKTAFVNDAASPTGFFVPVAERTVEISVGAVVLTAEVADSPEEWRKGLSGRSALAQNEGMFFAFPYDAFHSFWMKDMNFPIDIIWTSSDLKIVDITRNVTPESFPLTFQPKEKARYVLEVNAGWSDEHGAQLGQTLVFKGR